MKNLRTSVLCVCISFYSLCTAAQSGQIPINEPDYNKPKLFTNLPETIPVSINNLNNLLTARNGNIISTNLSDNSQVVVLFEGKVVSTAQDGNKVQSVAIKSNNYNGATLTISKVLNEEGNVTYTGRLISFQHGDLYVLQLRNNEYVLAKKNFYELVNE